MTTSSKYKNPFIIDSGASDHMMDSYHLFSTYISCVTNIKVKIADGSLSTVAEKGNTQISGSITLNLVLYVPKTKSSAQIMSSNTSIPFYETTY